MSSAAPHGCYTGKGVFGLERERETKEREGERERGTGRAYPDSISTELGSDSSISRPSRMCAVKVGVSPAWKGAMSHSSSEAPLQGPPVYTPWQQTMMRWVGMTGNSVWPDMIPG